MDIVDEMRTRSRELKEAWGEKPDGVENMLDIWSDRIEAIAKRERAPAGNAEALREALEGMCKASQDVFRSFARETFAGERRLDSLGVAFDKAKVALSAPARQCDVGTAEEQEARMMRYCEGRKCEECQFFYGVNEGVNCDFTWAQTPYAEEGGRKREQKQLRQAVLR